MLEDNDKQKGKKKEKKKTTLVKNSREEEKEEEKITELKKHGKQFEGQFSKEKKIINV